MERSRVHAPVEAIYLPPNGVNVHYVRTRRMDAVEGAMRDSNLELTHPRAYLTHEAYRFALFSLVFCEWTNKEDTPATTRYFGFALSDADEIVDNKNKKNPIDDPELIVPLSQGTRAGGFYDVLRLARHRRMIAELAYTGHEKRADKDGMAPYLAFLASVARHDDPVSASTLSPIECIARAALVAHEKSEDARRNAMAILAKQKRVSFGDEVAAWFMDIVCDVLLFVMVYGYDAYRLVDYAAFLLVRALGTGIGRVMSACLGQNAAMCLVLVAFDILLVVLTVIAPFMASFNMALLTVAVSSALGEAKARCKSTALDWILESLSSQVARIVTTLLEKVSFNDDVDTIIAAARDMLDLTSIRNLGTSMVVGAVFKQIDALVKRELNERLSSFWGCLARLAAHFAISKILEGTVSEELGGTYRRMLVPKWMNIAVMGAGFSRAEEQKKLMETSEKIERVNTMERELNEKTNALNSAQKEASNAQIAVQENDDKSDITDKIDTDEIVRLEDILIAKTTKAEGLENQVKLAQLEVNKAKEATSGVAQDYKEKAEKYYTERKDAYEDAKTKGGAAKTSEEEATDARKKAIRSRNIAGKPGATDEQKQTARSDESNANDMRNKATIESAESKSADRTDHFRNAATRDREQKLADTRANHSAKQALSGAQAAFDAAEKELKDAKGSTGPQQPDHNGTDTKSGASRDPTVEALQNKMDAAKTTLDEAKPKAGEAQEKVDNNAPNWASTLVGWWAKVRGTGTAMGMAHYV